MNPSITPVDRARERLLEAVQSSDKRDDDDQRSLIADLLAELFEARRRP